MITNNTIKKRLRASAPQVKDNEAFMEDTIRQINLMPSPSSELQESLRRYTMLERLAMQMDAVRGLWVGGTGSIAVGYAIFSHLEAILSALSVLWRLWKLVWNICNIYFVFEERRTCNVNKIGVHISMWAPILLEDWGKRIRITIPLDNIAIYGGGRGSCIGLEGV